MLREMGLKAGLAARKMAMISTEAKDAALLDLADRIWSERQKIYDANNTDIELGLKAGMSEALLDRLTLTEKRLIDVAGDLRNVASLPDPIGEHFDEHRLPNGLFIRKQRVPIGVLGVIYESRPNVTIDVVGLSLKAGNCVILRGGSETINSNRALVEIIHSALGNHDLPIEAVQFIDNPDRELVTQLLKMHDQIDMLIPRGGKALHRYCSENSLIPVITGGLGICHLYVDKAVDQEAVMKIVQNAKVQRPSVCNALDTLLVHEMIAADFLPALVEYMAPDGVSFRVHENAQTYLSHEKSDSIQPAGLEDFDQEWLSLVLGIKVVSGIDEAVEHILEHSTFHSDGILTLNEELAGRFVAAVDSAVVFVNASTRFNDGAQMGLGAEVAVSTQRLHARGPMGLKELTTYKWVVIGNNHIRE
jgi:glutamate-5-semialdehyde dehydrogenase